MEKIDKYQYRFNNNNIDNSGNKNFIRITKSRKKKFQHIQHSNVIRYRYRKQMAYNSNDINSNNINKPT